jgi:hypothetical protein
MFISVLHAVCIPGQANASTTPSSFSPIWTVNSWPLILKELMETSKAQLIDHAPVDLSFGF